MLALADYYGNTAGYSPDKMRVGAATTRGEVLDVPILRDSPWIYELQVEREVPLDGSDIFVCRIRNILAATALLDETKSVEERLQSIAPIRTTCQTYLSFSGRAWGKWGEPQSELRRSPSTGI